MTVFLTASQCCIDIFYFAAWINVFPQIVNARFLFYLDYFFFFWKFDCTRKLSIENGIFHSNTEGKGKMALHNTKVFIVKVKNYGEL